MHGVFRIQQKCTREYLKNKVSAQVSGQQKALARYAPLFLKNWFLRTMYRFNGHSTMVLSNIGKISPLEEFAPYIAGYRCALPVTEKEPLKVSVCSFRDKLMFTVASSLVENRFCVRLQEIFRSFGISAAAEAGVSERLCPQGRKAYGTLQKEGKFPRLNGSGRVLLGNPV